MGLFFELLSAVNNPNQRGSVDQLRKVMDNIQALSANSGISLSTMQTVMSALGSSIYPTLKQQTLTTGNQSLDSWVDQFSGTTLGTRALQLFLIPELQQQILQRIAQRTGLNPTILQPSLPELLMAAMNFLSMGESHSGMPGLNPVLKTFLNSEHNGADLGDVFKFTHRFLNPG